MCELLGNPPQVSFRPIFDLRLSRRFGRFFEKTSLFSMGGAHGFSLVFRANFNGPIRGLSGGRF